MSDGDHLAAAWARATLAQRELQDIIDKRKQPNQTKPNDTRRKQNDIPESSKKSGEIAPHL